MTAPGGGAARRVVVTGAGVVSPLGDSPAALHGALCRGETGLAPLAAFAADGLPCRRAGEVRDFDPARYLGEANFRPLDRTGRLAVVAAGLALDAAGLPAERRAASDVGLALGTMFGSVHTISEFDRRALTAGPNYVKPFDFANSVINAAAGQTAIWHDLAGVNSTLGGGPTAGLEALAYAAGLVASGRVEAILAGGADELCFESFYGFARAGLLCGAGPGAEAGGEERPVPFDARRNGFALGEGAALLRLESEASAAARGVPVLATLRGWGSAYDPSRGRDEASAARAVERAVRAALGAAAVAPEEVDALIASASGSVAGDRREAAGVAAALSEAAGLPATAIKSMVGEGLGAGGALQAVTLLEAMRTGLLPGVRGLETPEPGLALPGVAAATRAVAVQVGLLTALDFDGAAAALVVERKNGRPAAAMAMEHGS
jgi:3-oxoacyl-[acyl-carrier-protein] synthase II